jgi:hypothetical protein
VPASPESASRHGAERSRYPRQDGDSAHGGDATLPRSSCLAPLRAVPRAVGTRPLDRRRRLTGT